MHGKRIGRGPRRSGDRWAVTALLPVAVMLAGLVPASTPRPNAPRARTALLALKPLAAVSARRPAPPSHAPMEVSYSTSSLAVPVVAALSPRYIVSRWPQPVLYSVATRQRVVFITIDDGWTRDPRVVRLVRTLHLPITVFLIQQAGDSSAQVAFFRSLQAAGARIEDHTVNHPFMTALSATRQRDEICRTARTFRRLYGRAPTMFRPPYGAYNSATLRAAASCGMGATFMWSAVMSSRHLSYAHRGGLQPGDIVLFHFRPELYDELKIMLQTMRARNLGIGSLQDFIRFGPRPITPPEPVPSPVATLA